MSDQNQNQNQQRKINQIPPAVQESASDDVKQAVEEQFKRPEHTPVEAQDILIRSLLAREARQAKKELEVENQNEARSKQRAINAKNRSQRLFAKQQRCTHLKGGKIKSKTGIKDYALFRHMYIDRQELIGCFICKMRWRPRDTKEYLVRDGRKIRNHTKIGWLEACELFEQSSNSVTSSEIPISSRQDEFDGAEDIGPAEAQ